MAVPTVQAAYCGTVAPIMKALSKRPPALIARAQEVVTIV
jgi:hypothetical protein